uniref:CCHC-type domain-containing protein n=1 Tax=Tanacetum cinerariifolium TaxID=118510 RepID=A0A6L2LXW7_TANCI|nr:hypothetical protein [Tanacetum cinerariifolium]
MKQLNGVTFDEHGIAIGKEHSPFACYVRRVTKAMISILIDDRRKLPKSDKTQLWIEIKEHCRLKNDDCKTQVLKLCNQFWKSFKKDLRTDYMYKKRSPCNTYMFIEPGTWKEFVKMESTLEKWFVILYSTGSEHDGRTRWVGHLVLDYVLVGLARTQLEQAEQELLQTTRDFHSYRQEEGQSVSSYVLKMKGYIDNLERLGHPVTLGLGTVNELHAMLKLHEQTLPKNNAPALNDIRADKVHKGNKHKKSQSQTVARGQNHGKGKNKQAYAPKPNIPPPPKRENPAKDSICHECGKIGHWKRNCPQYLAELLKKKNNVASGAGGSGIFIIELNTILNRSWIYDTGCVNGQREAVEAIGAFYLCLPSGLEIVLKNCHYAPSITRGVISVSRLYEDGFVNRFVDSKKRIEKLQHDGVLDSSDLRAFEKCVSCMSGKMERKPYTHQVERAKELLGLIHTDICGPFKIMSRQRASYFITFTDDFNRYGSTRTRHALDRMCLYIAAEEHELGDLDDKVWFLVKLPPNGKTVGSKWLFKKKTNMDGNVHIYKARLVAKGYTQTSGIDYEETFSPVAYIRAIRILIAIAMYYDYEIRQMDVKTTFLNGYLNEEEKLKLSKSQGASTPAELKRMQNVPYASAVGSIMYVVRCTRPDVAFAQNVTSRFQQNSGDVYWTTVKNILKYLRNTKDMFLFHEGDLKREFRVSCYTDVGYLTDADDLKSQTGYVFVLNGGDVDWKSAKQSIFSTSSAEAKYIAAFDASKEAVLVRKFIYGLGVVLIIEEPIRLYCDNTGAIAIANESGIVKGARHFRAKVHYLREVIEYGDIKLEKVHTYDNLADPFTKALAFPKHSEHTKNIRMLPASSFMRLANAMFLPYRTKKVLCVIGMVYSAKQVHGKALLQVLEKVHVDNVLGIVIL